jgi:microsomal dipeptidase-like Zn-dependent dipeptidase
MSPRPPRSHRGSTPLRECQVWSARFLRRWLALVVVPAFCLSIWCAGVRAQGSAPFQVALLDVGTRYAPETDGVWTMADYDRDGIPDLVFIKTSNVASGKIEVHIASGASNYQTSLLDVPTRYAPETDGVWTMADYDRDGIPDLVFIKTSNVASGKIEVHIASGASNYQTSLLDVATRYAPETDGVWTMADYDHDGIPDLVFIKTGNTGTGKIEVHIASGASNYQTSLLDVGTRYAPETDGVWMMADFDRDGSPDLVFIKTSNTGTGKIEVHIASGASSYESPLLDVGTRFAPETDGVWTMADYDRNGVPDLVFIKTSNTGTGKIEAHIAADSRTVWGVADLHTHPASHLGFGSDANGNNGIFWGKPGNDLAGSSSAAAIANDMPQCEPDSHGAFDADPVRKATHQQIITATDSGTEWSHGANGAPGFSDWPAALSLEHQQMHITEIKRAFDGGVRLILASATDNQLLSDLWRNIGTNLNGNPIPTPDNMVEYNSAISQITFIRGLVAANSSWMQIATTPAEARQAINNNKMAVILSLELDSLSADQILDLVTNHQVRHVIPVHLADSSFGGAALYDDTFNANSFFLNGSYFGIKTSKCVSFTLGVPQHLVKGPIGAIEIAPVDATTLASLGYSTDPALGGQENIRGLNNSEFLRLMRAGVLLDVAHMGEVSAAGALGLATQFGYPLMDSHSGVRDDRDCSNLAPPGVNERSIPFSQVKTIARLGGVIGLGTANTQMPDGVEQWLKNYQTTLSLMGGRGVALGTDFNGLSPEILSNVNQSHYKSTYPITIASKFNPPPGLTTPSLSQFQLSSRTFDFAQDGIAHYGMLPDFFQAVSERPDIAGAEGVACSVFDDGYTNMAGPSDAIYIAPGLQACMPGSGPDGTCRKWFGRCHTTSTNVPVTFSVFDDEYANKTGGSDAVYVHQQSGLKSCIPDGTADGTCRRWFGQGTTSDGRPVVCSVFEDGYAHQVGSTDATYFLGLLSPNSSQLDACMPGQGPNGICRKWTGRCFALPNNWNPNPAAIPALNALFHSAEDVIAMWERVNTAAMTIPPADPVVCSVFDDGTTNVAGPSDAVYIAPGLQACIPSSTATGTCRKWFGTCHTTTTNVPVNFSVFDDGGANQTAGSGGVYIHQQGGLKSCIPDGTANGTCRRWFGQGMTTDGRAVSCSVFDDGYTNQEGASGATYILGVLTPSNASLQACIPGGPNGECRKWFGRCEAASSELDDPRVFDVNFYLSEYPDLRAAFGTNLAAARNHWYTQGFPVEGRRGSREFDVQFYLNHYGDLKSAFGTNYAAALHHWLTQGLPVEGRRASREFDVQFYLANYLDLRSEFGGDYAAAAEHWLRQGLPADGRAGSFEVDVAYYLNTNGDLVNAFGFNDPSAIDHWITQGLPNEGRRSSLRFDVKYYLSAYADLQVAFGKTNYTAAFDHWVNTGRAEGRHGVPPLKTLPQPLPILHH